MILKLFWPAFPVLILTSLENVSPISTKTPSGHGNDTYKLLRENLAKSAYRKLIKLTHHSYRMSKEKYKEVVFNEIG